MKRVFELSFLTMAFLIFLSACSKDEPEIVDSIILDYQYVDGRMHFKDSSSFANYIEARLIEDNFEVFLKEEFPDLISYNSKVDEIFDFLETEEEIDQGFFELPSISKYIRLQNDEGEISVEPLIESRLLGSILNHDAELSIGKELINFSENKMSKYALTSMHKKTDDLIVEHDIIQSDVSTSKRAKVAECDGYYSSNKRRVKGKITSRIYWIYNEWTVVVKNQKKRWYGWTDYKCDHLGLEGTAMTRFCTSGPTGIECMDHQNNFNSLWDNTRREQIVIFHNFGDAVQVNNISWEEYDIDYHAWAGIPSYGPPSKSCNNSN